MMDSEILVQLTQIKWLLVVYVMVMLIANGIRIYSQFLQNGGLGVSKFLRSNAVDDTRALLDAGEDAKALTAAEILITKAPGDATGFWLHATATYRTGNMLVALHSLRRAAVLQPDWDVGYVQPFILAIESQLNSSKQEADLDLLTPSPALNIKAPLATLAEPHQPTN